MGQQLDAEPFRKTVDCVGEQFAEVGGCGWHDDDGSSLIALRGSPAQQRSYDSVESRCSWFLQKRD
jgi:hypothetical protein